MNIIPNVIESYRGKERFYDIFSKLLKDRIIFLIGEITQELSSTICSQLIYLDHEDSTKDIIIYINSPGGCVYSSLAIYDMMTSVIKSNINTVIFGLAASGASIISTAGTKGKRLAFKHSRLMLHQPLISRTGGQTTDLEIITKEMIAIREDLYNIYEKSSNFLLNKENIINMIDRDFYINPNEAKKLGFIDHII